MHTMQQNATNTLLVIPIEILIHIVSRRFSVSADTDGLQFNSDVTLTLLLLLWMKIMILTAVSQTKPAT